jgi:predicted transcriptional regulator
MQHVKEEMRHILEQLPDNATWDDVQYHIYVRQKIDRGLDDVARGRLLTEEDFDRRMRRWLEP